MRKVMPKEEMVVLALQVFQDFKSQLMLGMASTLVGKEERLISMKRRIPKLEEEIAKDKRKIQALNLLKSKKYDNYYQ